MLKYNGLALINKCRTAANHHAKLRYMDKLSLVVIESHEYIDELMTILRSENIVKYHSMPPLCWLPATNILYSNDKFLIQKLVDEVSLWDAFPQYLLLSHFAGKDKIVTLTKQLKHEYNFNPNYLINRHGDLEVH